MSGGGSPRIWFLDTSSLLSMAVDLAVAAEVHAETAGDRVIIIDIVADELDHRAKQTSTQVLAKRALAAMRPTWTELSTSAVPLDKIVSAQQAVADGRALTDDEQHWAESVIIALVRHSASVGANAEKILLSEDYDARREAAKVDYTRAVSLHGLLRDRVRAGSLSAQAAADLADKLHAAKRAGRTVSAEEFADPSPRGLRRLGEPC